MIRSECFSTLRRDFLESFDFVEMAHQELPCHEFVCHHNSYLAHRFLQRRGHNALGWTRGIYHCSSPRPPVQHSWLSLSMYTRPAVILELDPHQLHSAGGYPNDPMPSDVGRLAVIIDPALVVLDMNVQNDRWIIRSREVLVRYEQDALTNLDYDMLNQIDAETQAIYDDHQLRLAELE